jgi:hypothetical protein
VVALLGVLALLGGCAITGTREAGAKPDPTTAAERSAAPAKPAAPASGTRLDRTAAAPGDAAAPPTPQWRTTGEAVGSNSPVQSPVPAGPAFTPFSPTQPNLGREVALICGSARINKPRDHLSSLVTDLYLSNVDPALSTEALLQGDCGTVADIVRELVAQGGNEVVSAVVSRALFLSGPRAEGTIRAAAASGLDRDLVSPMPRSEPTLEPAPLSYSMAYFPSRGAESGIETATVIDTLYRHATPGYGVYTFVLPGGGFDPKREADRARFAELLRVIETYVLAGEQGVHGPRAEAHAFLIAIRPDRKGAKLSEQMAPELAAAMRSDLIQYLRRHGQTALAARLEVLPGPFLISSLEPRLIPTNELAPRLVTDLSQIGPEYLYAVIDAYDRSLVPEQQGRPEALGGIRERLLALFSRKADEEEPSPAIKDAWVFRLGGPAAAKTGGQTAAAPAPEVESGTPDASPASPKRTPKKFPRRS